jgi:uncharacterized repeat protein (TIGR01451 family)
MRNPSNTKIKHGFWLIAACLAGLIARPVQGQMVFYYDASGNPTNSVLSGSTSVSDSVTNSTPITMNGGAISLEVLADGSGPISYQWLLNGVNITGATNATFFKTNVNVGDAGAYSVIITGLTGSQTNSLGNVTVLANTNTLYAVVYGLSQYIAVGANGTIVGSSNLVSWSAPTSGTTNHLRGITLGSNIVVAVGASGTVVTSTNGTTWVQRTSEVTNDLNGVAFGRGVFVAVGTGGTALTSPDGVTWTRQTYDNPTLEAVTFGTNLFVAVGTGGTIWNSSNGTNWLGHDWATTNFLSSVAFGNGLFVALGGSGLILSSADGTNWSQQATSTDEAFTSALFFNNTFFALGAIGENFISADGTHWGEISAGTFVPLFGSGAGNEVPVAVGENGTVVQIPYSLLDHFSWSAISSPQRVSLPFAASITAQDAANNTVTNFTGSTTLSAATGQTWSTNTLLGNIDQYYTGIGSGNIGNAFTPNADILVTQVRHILGTQVSIWDEDQNPLLSMNVTNNPNTWVSTPVPVPLVLKAGKTYVLGVYCANGTNTSFYYSEDLPTTFNDGTLDQAFWGATTSNLCPALPETVFWNLIDLTYVVQRNQSNSVSPTTATFANGIASVNASVSNAGQGVTLTATDSAGHTGASNPFNVYATNDLALTLTASPSPVPVNSNLTYTIMVVNGGPNSATGVNVTNVLPANVGFVSASSGQGTPQYANGKVTCNVGTLGNLGSNTISIVVTSSVAGIMLTNTVSVTETGSDSNLSDNTATVTTYVPPTLSIGSFGNYEGNTNTSYWLVPVTLSSASVLPVYFDETTLDGTNSTPAIAWRDYVPSSVTWYFPPGMTSNNISVGIQGNTIIEPDKQFLVRLSNPVNATFLQSQATITISNDDGLIGQVYRLAWGNIPSPQRTNQSFVASITAQDTNGTAVSGFSGPVTLTGINVNGPSTTNMLTDLSAESSANAGIFTIGYQFTPSTNIYVTHVRSYGGTKVSIWTDTGNPVVSQTVSNVPGTWVETPLQTPVPLLAGLNYRIGVFTDGGSYYWRDDASRSFANGQITEGYSSPGDSFPTNVDSAQWYLVDLRYVLAASETPTSSGNFTNGLWTGNITAQEIGTNFILMADDRNGHLGFSNPFGAYQINDLALTLSSSPAVPLVWTNIIYAITVLNPGPNASTGVFVTNTLPAGATFVSAVSSQGTCTQFNGIVTCNLGTINGLASATVTNTITPLVAGLPLTNSATATRNEADPNLSNNSAVSVLIPSLALSLALSQATEYFWTPWRTGGDALWGFETNVTHDGIDAAQSGAIIDSQQTWMETSIRGPGTLSFWWKVSSQAGGDFLSFRTNGVTVTNISGNVDWQQVTFSPPPGPLTLRWSYIKDGSISSGSDAGWLDQVSYSVPPFSLISPTLATNGNFLFTVTGTNGQQLILQSSTNLHQWTSLVTNTVANGMINFTDTFATNFMSHFYRALFMNQ